MISQITASPEAEKVSPIRFKPAHYLANRYRYLPLAQFHPVAAQPTDMALQLSSKPSAWGFIMVPGKSYSIDLILIFNWLRARSVGARPRMIHRAVNR
jgi:hypothetical protein